MSNKKEPDWLFCFLYFLIDTSQPLHVMFPVSKVVITYFMMDSWYQLKPPSEGGP